MRSREASKSGLRRWVQSLPCVKRRVWPLAPFCCLVMHLRFPLGITPALGRSHSPTPRWMPGGVATPRHLGLKWIFLGLAGAAPGEGRAEGPGLLPGNLAPAAAGRRAEHWSQPSPAGPHPRCGGRPGSVTPRTAPRDCQSPDFRGGESCTPAPPPPSPSGRSGDPGRGRQEQKSALGPAEGRPVGTLGSDRFPGSQ